MSTSDIIRERLSRISLYKSQIKEQAITKGADISEETPLSSYADKILAIQKGSGGDASEVCEKGAEACFSYFSKALKIAPYFFEGTKITEASFPYASIIGRYAFYGCLSLTYAYLPSCVTVGSGAFYGCSSISSVTIPNCSYIGSDAFKDCNKLKEISLNSCIEIGNAAFSYCYSLSSVFAPVCEYIGSYAFGECSSLTTVSFPMCKSIKTAAFWYCSRLSRLYLKGPNLVVLESSHALAGTIINSSTSGKIYVPSSLYYSYKSATNWVYFSSRFVSV